MERPRQSVRGGGSEAETGHPETGSGTTGSLARTMQCLKTIERLDGTFQAFITVSRESALKDAERADRAREGGDWTGHLHGVPIAIKDNIQVAGQRCTSGSRFFSDFIPEEDAPVIRRLRQAGAVLIGKTNLHEFAYGGTTQNEHYGFCRNAWDPGRLPGGSSGGSAVAVAAGMCEGAIGTDTGASIRLPAALNGISGLRPTTGAVSNRGVTPVSPPHDTVGPMARRVSDLARMYAAIVGYDPEDPHSADRQSPDVLAHLAEGIEGVCIAMPVFGELVSAETGSAMSLEMEQARAETFGSSPDSEDPVDRGFSRGVNASMRQITVARMKRDALITTMERFLQDWDVLLCPVTSTPAPPHCDVGSPINVDGQPVPYWTAGGSYTTPFNLTGQPVVGIPLTYSSEGLPIGLQIIGRRWGEMPLLQIAEQLEEFIGVCKRPPGY